MLYLAAIIDFKHRTIRHIPDYGNERHLSKITVDLIRSQNLNTNNYILKAKVIANHVYSFAYNISGDKAVVLAISDDGFYVPFSELDLKKLEDDVGFSANYYETGHDRQDVSLLF